MWKRFFKILGMGALGGAIGAAGNHQLDDPIAQAILIAVTTAAAAATDTKGKKKDAPKEEQK